MRTKAAGVRRAAVIVAGLLALSLASAAERPVTGLLWRSGDTPAVFPLQVRTRAGRDYHLVLVDAESGTETLAAYVRGGEFFRVLVPPGRYELSFAYGTDWQGEAALFGPGKDTGKISLSAPLTFGVAGLGRKFGHQVDLRGGTPGAPELAGISAQALCQSLVLDLDSLDWPRPAPRARRAGAGDPSGGAAGTTGRRFPAPRYDLGTRLCTD